MEIVQPITNDIYRQKVRRTDIIVEMTLKNIDNKAKPRSGDIIILGIR